MEDTKDTIPVFIDKIDWQKMLVTIRFYYFVISLQTKKKSEQCQQAILTEDSNLQKLTPAINWYGSTEQFFLQSSLTGTQFETPQDVDELFDFIDAANLELQAEYHTVIFESQKSIERLLRQDSALARGAVYRIQPDTLQDVLLGHRAISPSFDELAFSSAETESFAQWNQHVIHTVKERYHEQPEKTLTGRRGNQ